MANEYTFYIGVSFVWPMTWKAGGVAVNLTGKTFDFRLLKGSRELVNLVTGEAATTLGSQLTVVSAAAGTLLLKITDEETATFRAGTANIFGIMKYVGADGLEHLMFKQAFTIEKA